MKSERITRRSDLPDLAFSPFLSVTDKPVFAVQLEEAGDIEHPFASNGTFKGSVGAWRVTYGHRC